MIFIDNQKLSLSTKLQTTIYDLEDDYKDDKSIWRKETVGQQLLSIINDPTIIDPLDKRIFILYLEMGSLRKTEAICGISHRSVQIIVNKVKNKIYEILY